jgi:hypothetical protein
LPIREKFIVITIKRVILAPYNRFLPTINSSISESYEHNIKFLAFSFEQHSIRFLYTVQYSMFAQGKIIKFSVAPGDLAIQRPSYYVSDGKKTAPEDSMLKRYSGRNLNHISGYFPKS